MRELIELWATMLGTPPSEEQFTVWLALHSPEIVRQGIIRTAAKNLSLGKTMDSDYRIRFASKVMLVQAERSTKNAANKERLRQEFEGRTMTATTEGELP